MKYIDTHCHILPGIDDGPPDLAASLDMARIAAADGIDAIVATPHIIEGLYDSAGRDKLLAQLTEAMAQAGIAIRLYAGAEVPMSMCLGESRDFLEKMTMAGSRYLLMETAQTTYDQLSKAVYQVRLSGFYPILAHPERVGFVRERPGSLAGIIEQGNVYCQLTAAGIEGSFGKSMKRCAADLLKLGLAHLVASDGHSSVKRPPRLSACHKLIRDMIGREAAAVIMQENPVKVINNEPLLAVDASGKHRRGYLSRLIRGNRS